MEPNGNPINLTQCRLSATAEQKNPYGAHISEIYIYTKKSPSTPPIGRADARKPRKAGLIGRYDEHASSHVLRTRVSRAPFACAPARTRVRSRRGLFLFSFGFVFVFGFGLAAPSPPPPLHARTCRVALSCSVPVGRAGFVTSRRVALPLVVTSVRILREGRVIPPHPLACPSRNGKVAGDDGGIRRSSATRVTKMATLLPSPPSSDDLSAVFFGQAAWTTTTTLPGLCRRLDRSLTRSGRVILTSSWEVHSWGGP